MDLKRSFESAAVNFAGREMTGIIKRVTGRSQQLAFARCRRRRGGMMRIVESISCARSVGVD